MRTISQTGGSAGKLKITRNMRAILETQLLGKHAARRAIACHKDRKNRVFGSCGRQSCIRFASSSQTPTIELGLTSDKNFAMKLISNPVIF